MSEERTFITSVYIILQKADIDKLSRFRYLRESIQLIGDCMLGERKKDGSPNSHLGSTRLPTIFSI